MDAKSYCAEYYLLSDKNKLTTLNNIGVLHKGVLIDLHARNFMHSKIFLRACCVHACHRAWNLSSPEPFEKMQ